MYDIQFHSTTGKPQQNIKEDTFKASVCAVHLQGAGVVVYVHVCACVGGVGYIGWSLLFY